MKQVIYISLLVLLTACQKEKITISANASEVFYVENDGAAMRMLVQGNTGSKTFILVIHGGPGASSYFYDTQYIRENLGDKYAMVYWDQRNAGASQGSANGAKLHLDQIVQDLNKVIKVLKYRYGQDMSLFLLGHSFGGLIAADFITHSDYQNLINGLINVDGSHNYPLNDTLTRQMLLSSGEREVLNRRNVDKWIPIVNYCSVHKGNFSFEESQQLEQYASEAESYIDSVKHINFATEVLKYAVADKYPLTAMVGNLLYSEDSDFNKELSITQFSSLLNKVKIPVLVLWGKYDFTCPEALGKDFYLRIGSASKKMVISAVSGHNMMLQDEKLFCDEVNSFVQDHK
jgi:pimeloyl-ACP methyl ester carboxylesterase